MGKSKRRSLNKGINSKFTTLSRDEALKLVILACDKKEIDDEIKNLVLLFGFSAEELLEGGAKYEDVLVLKCVLS